MTGLQGSLELDLGVTSDLRSAGRPAGCQMPERLRQELPFVTFHLLSSAPPDTAWQKSNQSDIGPRKKYILSTSTTSRCVKIARDSRRGGCARISERKRLVHIGGGPRGITFNRCRLAPFCATPTPLPPFDRPSSIRESHLDSYQDNTLRAAAVWKACTPAKRDPITCSYVEFQLLRCPLRT